MEKILILVILFLSSCSSKTDNVSDEMLFLKNNIREFIQLKSDIEKCLEQNTQDRRNNEIIDKNWVRNNWIYKKNEIQLTKLGLGKVLLTFSDSNKLMMMKFQKSKSVSSGVIYYRVFVDTTLIENKDYISERYIEMILDSNWSVIYEEW